jgi:hypothetical protein
VPVGATDVTDKDVDQLNYSVPAIPP